MATTIPDRDWTALARTAAAGGFAAIALFAVLVFGVQWTPRSASELTFSLAALPFSLGLIGWATVLLSGNAIEGFSRQFNVSRTWNKEGGRDAMARLIAVGAGAMVGASLAGAPYGV